MSFHRPMQSVVILSIAVLVLSQAVMAGEKKAIATDPLPTSAVSRLGTLRWAHGNEVDFATYLQDGQQVLTVDQNGLFRVWDTRTGKLLRQFGKGNREQIYWYVQRSNDKSKQIEIVGNPNARHVVALSPSGKTVAIAHGDGNISIWDIATGQQVITFEASLATTLTFSPDGQSLFTRGLDQLVRQYASQTGKEIRIFGEKRFDEKSIYCNDFGALMVSKDAKSLFTIHLELVDQQVQVFVRSWEIATGKQHPAFLGMKTITGYASVAFSTQSQLVALCDQNGDIHVWDLVASKQVHQIKGPKISNSGYCSAMAFTPDGQQLIARTSYELMQLWNMADGKEVRSYSIAKDRPSDFYIGNLAFSADGSRLISPGRASTIRQLLIHTGKEVEGPVNQHFGTVEALALSHDGKNAVTQSHDHVLHLWNVVDGTEIKRVQLTDRIDRASFSEDGKILAVAGYGDQLHIGIWDAVHLTVLREWKVSSELDGRPTPSRRCVFALSLSANGQRLAVRDYAWATKIWEIPAAKDQPVKEYPVTVDREEDQQYFSGKNLALSPDGTLIAELASTKVGKTAVRLCEVATGKLVRIFNIPQPTIRTFAFSADGRMLAITNLDRSISLWEVATGQERASLGRARLTELPPVQTENVEASRTGDLPQNGELTCLTFSADGNRLAAGDSAGRVRLFDLKTGKEQTPLSGHIGPVVSLAFAANGRHLISGSTDMTALVWDVSMQPREENRQRNLDPKQLEALWATLRGNDAKKAYEAVRMLRDHPNLVVPFVQKQLRTITVDPKRLAQLIRDLDDDVFTTRENAQMELEKLGELSADAIRTALKGNPSLETQQRLEQLQKRIGTGDSSPPDYFRALEILETIGTPETLRVIQHLATGSSASRVTREAQATADRMVRKIR